MYIPTWILVIAVVAGLYFAWKRSRKPDTESVGKLTDDQKEMLNHIANFRKKTGRDMPSYEEMLKMDEKELQTWTLIRVSEQYRPALLEEMISHEEKTDSFKKTARKELSDGERIVLSVFDRNESAKVVNALGKMGEVLLEDDVEKKDFVRDAIFAKIASDHVGLGEKYNARARQA